MTAKSKILQILFFSLTITMSDGLAEIRWYVCISKSQIILHVSFCRSGLGLCIYHLFLWSNFSFLQNFQWITISTQSCLVLYSFCANFLPSCDWSFSLYDHITNVWYLVAPYQFLLWYNWSFWRCIFAAVGRNVQLFSFEILLVCQLKYPYNCFYSHLWLLVIVVLFTLVFFLFFWLL